MTGGLGENAWCKRKGDGMALGYIGRIARGYMVRVVNGHGDLGEKAMCK